MATTSSYEAIHIEVLSGLEAVRRRPGMFVGDLDATGMHNMLWEVVGNAIDEHLTTRLDGYVRIQLDDDRVIVEDNGRGMPVEGMARERPWLEHTMTSLMHQGSAKRPHIHLGVNLHGVGLGPVCALSSELVVEVWRFGGAYVQRFARGVPITPLEERGPTQRSGTRISFAPDFTVFESGRWDRALIARRARQLAALAPNVTMIVEGDAFRCPDGLLDHVRWIARDPVGAPFHVREMRDGIAVECALAWARHGAGTVEAFVNCAPTPHGTHVDGLFAALEAVLGRRLGSTRASRFRSRIGRGLVAYVNATLEHPRFQSPTRDWLDNPEVGQAVRSVIENALTTHLARDPALLDAMLIRIGA